MSSQLQQKNSAPFKCQINRFRHSQKEPKKELKQIVTRQQAISNILAYSEKNNNLIELYNEDFFVSYFDRQTIEDLAQTIPPNLEIKKNQFVKRLTTFISHNKDETLFLIISLIGIYKKIKDETKAQNGIKFSDFTSHICEKISSLGAELLIPLKQVPGQKSKPNPLKVRSIDLQPPVIVSEVEKQIPQISKDKKKKDKKIDPLKPLSQFCLSPSTQLIMTLGSLSSSINIFSMEFEKKTQIFPSCSKVFEKKLAILSFAFSQKQQRIGAIINNIGVAFWDFSDQFRTQKLIERTTVGGKIFYLELNDEWVTANENSIVYWDLKNESQKCVIKEEKSKNVNDICEITHIRAIGVSYTMKDDSKWVFIYQPHKKQRNNFTGRRSFIKKQDDSSDIEFKRLARVNLSPSGCHTLYYNRFTQIIIPLGYKDSISLYSIDSQSLDISLIHELKGHQTIVTSITEIDESDIIFTGDDRGHVIVWTLSDMRCQQLIRVANCINSLKCIGSRLYYGDTRINMISLEGINLKIQNKGSKFLSKSETFYGIFKSYRSERNEMVIFTRKACRILSMLNGKTLKIIELCGQEEEISIVENYFNGYIVGTSKGDISHYTLDFQLKWKLASAHESDTTELKVDQNNKFFLSNGRDSNVYIWADKTLLDEGPRKALRNGEDNIKEEISFTELSEKFGLFITCSFTNEVRVWDYESCRLVHVVEISHDKTVYPVAIKMCDCKPLLFVACSNQTLLIFKFSRKQNIFAVKVVGKIDKKVLTHQNNQRIQKKKSSIECFRGMSSTAQYQGDGAIEEGENRYAMSNTVHDISKQNDDNIVITNPFNEGNEESKPSSFLIEQILLDMSGNDYKLILVYNKGSLVHLNINDIITQNFESYAEEKFKKSANVQRPIKESLIRQIYKSQVDRTNFDKKKFNHVFTLDQKYVVWNSKLHKDSISHIDIFEGCYISTLCVDGYYKLISLYTGSTLCSININYPLPIKWDYKPHKSQEFCEKVQEALLLLDEIFFNVETLTKAQFQALNVRPFLEFICRPKTSHKLKPILLNILKENKKSGKQNTDFNDLEKLRNRFAEIKEGKQKQTPLIRNKPFSQSFKVEVLSDQFAPEDLKRTPLYYASLKSQEVYKRVKQFINVRDSELESSLQNSKQIESNRKKNQLEERQSIIELFSPNYLPKLLNKEFNQSLSQKLVLGEKTSAKVNVTLTKEDFKKIYEMSSSSILPATKEKSIEKPQKTGSKNKLTLDKLPNEIISKKMQTSAFNFRPQKFLQNPKKISSVNRSESESKLNINDNSLKMNRVHLLKEICEKTQQFKKMHRIVKI